MTRRGTAEGVTGQTLKHQSLQLMCREHKAAFGNFRIELRRYHVGRLSYRVVTLSQMGREGQEAVVAVPRRSTGGRPC